MDRPYVEFVDYFRSVGDVWFIWVICVVLVGILIRRAIAKGEWRRPADFSCDERGASYALPYLMTMPAYMLIFCVLIQATLIMLCKMGTVYAAYAAARTAIVWRSSQPERPLKKDERFELTARRATRAAIMAMTPFSSGFKMHRDELYGGLAQQILDWIELRPLDAFAYELMYRNLAQYSADQNSDASPIIKRLGEKELAKSDYVKNKLMYAAAATTVDFKDEKLARWNQDVELTVTFVMPIHIPGTGRIFETRQFEPFGPDKPKVYVRKISTTVKLPSEAVKSDSGRLNIPYDPAPVSDLRSWWESQRKP